MYKLSSLRSGEYKLSSPYFSKNILFLQARLHDIITSTNVANCKQHVEFPWMVDGAKVPTNAAQLLTELVCWLGILFHFSFELFCREYASSSPWILVCSVIICIPCYISIITIL
jgi:hypothetical protein